jgi:hypothetical protein
VISKQQKRPDFRKVSAILPQGFDGRFGSRLCENTINDMILLRFGWRIRWLALSLAMTAVSTWFPERLDDYLGDDNPVRAIDVFVDELDLARLGLYPFAEGRLVR